MAGLALVMQSWLGAQAIGASASSSGLSPFPGVICGAHGPETPPGETDPAKQRHLPDCCLAGCCLAGHTALPSPAMATIHLPRTAAGAAVPRSQPDPRVRARRGSPGNPRAPPLDA
jgi:hypothetical protein